MSNFAKMMQQAAAGAGGGGIDYGTFIQTYTDLYYDTDLEMCPYYDVNGNVYVATGINNSYVWVASFDIDGAFRWSNRLNTYTTYGQNPYICGVYEEDGVLYLLNRYDDQYSVTVELNSETGALLDNGGYRTSTLNRTSKGCVFTGTKIVQGGYEDSGNKVGLNIYSRTGDLQTVKYITYTGAMCTNTKPKTDEDGNIYLPWRVSGNTYCFISKYNSSYAHQWTVRFRTGTVANWFDMCVSSDLDAIYGICEFNDGDDVCNIIKWDRDGTKLYNRSVNAYDRYGFESSSQVRGGAIAIGADGYLYVGGRFGANTIYNGYEGKPGFVLKLDPDDLTYVDHFLVSPKTTNNFEVFTQDAGSPNENNLQSQILFYVNTTDNRFTFNFSGMPSSLPRTECNYYLFRCSDSNANMSIGVQNNVVSSSIISTATETAGTVSAGGSITISEYSAYEPTSMGCKTDLA